VTCGGKDEAKMNIGFTYDLRTAYLAMGYSEEETAEFDRESTIDAIAQTIEGLGHTVVRIGHARQLIERVATGERWDLVFNICEGLKGMAREAQVPAILDVYDIPYTFSDPLILALSLHKGMTKTVVRAAGVPTPDYLVVEREADIARVNMRYPLFAKPAGEGTGKGIDPGSILRNRSELEQRCRYLLERFRQPVLVEEYLPGRELTVGIVGTGDAAEVLGTLEVILLADAEPGVYSYVNKEDSETLVEYRLVRPGDDPVVREAEAIALNAWRALGCRDGGRLDLRCDASGRPQFIEVNPLAGLHPTHSDLPMIATAIGMSYPELLDRIIRSAARRCPAPAAAKEAALTP
jgi:D-alanine-D-alanine ligase